MEDHIESFAELNSRLAAGGFAALVQHAEALHQRRILRIAERVAALAPVVRLVLVAGPSSAGKTTTSIRLARALEDEGISALRLSTDDYFKTGHHEYRDEFGEVDWETIDCVDCVRLGADLAALFSGEAVHLRVFDFLAKTARDAARAVTLPPGGVVVLEGIHALNPALTAAVEEKLKFRVYLNVFTQPAAEDAVLLPDDTRFARRLVRDAAYRGESAAGTIARWPSVRRGEEKWINPHRGLADAVFNTGLDYELAVLKPLLEGKLAEAARDGRPAVAAEAKRLARIFGEITAVEDHSAIPVDSILRETVGGSALEY